MRDDRRRRASLVLGFVAICILCLLLCPTRLIAQTGNATISGRITDPSGAAVSGAKVQLKNTETGVAQTVLTNAEGIYIFSSANPGTYVLSVSQDGFRTLNATGLTLYTQDQVARNFKLELGSVTESVTVSGEAATLNTEDASVSTVVDRHLVENLPLNGRSFQSLLQLTPGVVVTPSTLSDNGQFSVNGQRATSNYWMVDGVSANIGITSTANLGNGPSGVIEGFSALGGTNSLVSVDALQEFRIQTSSFAPEFGRTPGAQVSIITRSGTNSFHGTMFDYLRNDALDASDWFNGFNRTTPLPKAKERQNDFGGTFSGPIIKNRLFFFLSYEGLRLRLPRTAITTVPCDNTCTVYGNARKLAIPAVQPFMNAFPLPNGPEVFDAKGAATGAAMLSASYSDPATLDAYSIRVDDSLSSKLLVFGRYNYSPSDSTIRAAGSPLSTVDLSSFTTHTATAGVTWSISPDAMDDLRFNYSRLTAIRPHQQDSFAGAVPPNTFPVSPSVNQKDFTYIWGILSLQGYPIQISSGNENTQEQFNIVNSFSLQRGTHSLKAGVDYRRLSPIVHAVNYADANYFLNITAAVNGALDFHAATTSRETQLLFRNIGTYAQDTWRVRPRVTITYGLRWDIDAAPTALTGPPLQSITGFRQTDLSQVALGPAGTSVFKTRLGNVAPRVGVSYQMSDTTRRSRVLRAGVGMFYDLATSEAGNIINTNQYPLGSSVFTFGGTFPASPAAAGPQPITRPTAGSNLYGFDPTLQLPYSLEWNVSLEQALGTSQNLTATYVGSSGRRLLQTVYVTKPNPTFSTAEIVSNLADSNYDALQVQFQRRVSHGLQGVVSYNWSHSIDTASSGSIASAGAPGVVPSGENRGPSSFDIRHALSAGLTYDIPSPKTNAFLGRVLTNWSVQNVVVARSAPPVDIVDARFPTLQGAEIAVRPDLVPSQPIYLYGSQYPGGRAFNPNAFQCVPTNIPGQCSGTPLRQGDTPRDFLRGLGAAQWDFSVHRDFVIRETLHLDFRTEMFNILNHPNFAPPSGSFGALGFGQSSQMLNQGLSGSGIRSGALSPSYLMGGPRSVQLALKLSF